MEEKGALDTVGRNVTWYNKMDVLQDSKNKITI
jgi:hypothetical protein